MSNLKGKRELQQRFVAIADHVPRQTAERWQKRATRIARDLVPNRGARSKGYSTGKLHDSVKAQPISVVKGRVVRARITMRHVGYFVDSGTRGNGSHSRINKRIRSRGLTGADADALFARRTVFTKKARGRRGGGYAARPFRERAAREAMRQTSMADILTDIWNGAA